MLFYNLFSNIINFPIACLQGMVVLAEPVNACEPIQKPPNADDTWIALIVRYNCSFEIKVRMAQLAGYDAAIVYNLQSNELGKPDKNSELLFFLRIHAAQHYSH